MTTATGPHGGVDTSDTIRVGDEHGSRHSAIDDAALDSRRELMLTTEDPGAGKVFAPSATPAAAWLAAILGIGLLGVCAVAIRDLIVAAGWISGDSWTRAAADWIGDLRWYEWMWPAAVALVVAGLLLLYVAVKPRKRTYVNVGPYGVMWTRRGDVARRCSAAVATLPGVEHATTVVGRRRAKVTVTTGGNEVDPAAIKNVAESVVDVLAKKPKVKVRIISRRNGERR